MDVFLYTLHYTAYSDKLWRSRRTFGTTVPENQDKEQQRPHKPDLGQDYVQEPNLGIWTYQGTKFRNL